jgi:hypothetical protein
MNSEVQENHFCLYKPTVRYNPILWWINDKRKIDVGEQYLRQSYSVVHSKIHFTEDVNKIIKYFFFLYILYFYYNMVNTIKKNKNYTTIYVSQKTYLSDFINVLN